MKIIKYILFSMAVSFAGSALAECQIIVPLCIGKSLPLNTAFLDDYDGSSINPNRCLLRAREYLNYCQSPHASAYFFSTGGYTVGVVVTPSTRQLYSVDRAARTWIPLASGL